MKGLIPNPSRPLDPLDEPHKYYDPFIEREEGEES